jgi:hypothetical protein
VYYGKIISGRVPSKVKTLKHCFLFQVIPEKNSTIKGLVAR